MITSARDHSLEVLLGIAIGVFKNAVVDPHGQRGDVAGGRGDFDPRIEGCDQGGLESAATGAGDVDALWIHIRTGEQVVQRTHAIPNLPAREIRARQVGEIAKHSVFSADQVVPALATLSIPELTALTLSDRIPGDHNVSTLD